MEYREENSVWAGARKAGTEDVALAMAGNLTYDDYFVGLSS
jgi:hypothetical protein